MSTITSPAPATPAVPDAAGRFGQFGGRYVPETLVRALDQLTEEYQKAKADKEFQSELSGLLRDFVGRPSPLYYAKRLSEQCGGAQIYFKREDLNHTGAHKINNTIGQCLLTLRMGKHRVIAETGAGPAWRGHRHRLCPFWSAVCGVHGRRRHPPAEAQRVSMKLLGAEVRPVTSGSRTLRDAINEAMRDWMASVDDTHYILGSVVGPHPFPQIVRDFQSVIGRETHRAVPRAARSFARPGGGLRRRRFATRRACSTPSSNTAKSNWSASKPAGGATSRATMPRPSPTASPACCTAASAT